MRTYYELMCCRALGLKHSKVGAGNMVQNLETAKLTTTSTEVMTATEFHFMQNKKNNQHRGHDCYRIPFLYANF
jgi:hypothetical protein